MVKPEITNRLRGSLGELYYKEYCDQKGWAYASLESIFNNSDFPMASGILEFKKGFHRIRVRIPDYRIPEILTISTPTNNSRGSPSFVFDFLACKVGEHEKYDAIIENPQLCWVEIKTGRGTLSANQVESLRQINLALAMFHIGDILVSPEKIEMSWDIKSGQEWLEELEIVEKEEEEEDWYGYGYGYYGYY